MIGMTVGCRFRYVFKTMTITHLDRSNRTPGRCCGSFLTVLLNLRPRPSISTKSTSLKSPEQKEISEPKTGAMEMDNG